MLAATVFGKLRAFFFSLLTLRLAGGHWADPAKPDEGAHLVSHSREAT